MKPFKSKFQIPILLLLVVAVTLFYACDKQSNYSYKTASFI